MPHMSNLPWNIFYLLSFFTLFIVFIMNFYNSSIYKAAQKNTNFKLNSWKW